MSVALFTRLKQAFLTIAVSVPILLSAQPRLLFSAQLSGAQEVPAVTTNGQGFVTVLVSEDLSKMQVFGVITGLSGKATAAHFHAGLSGANGGVVVNLASILSGNRISGELSVPAGLIRQMLAQGIYVNVHTAANPGGEIRGQLEAETDMAFFVGASGLEETPPVLTTAVGGGGFQMKIGSNKAPYNILTRGLSGPIVAAHIHEGALGASGPVVTPLTVQGNSLIGELDLSALPTDFISKAFQGKYYVNIHTAANPGGEIRGQLRFGGFVNGIAVLNGSQETPPVTTTAKGVGVIGVNATFDSLTYAVLYDGLSGPATAAHIHNAAAGAAGPVVAPLTPAPLVSGVYTGTIAANAALMTSFLKDNLYFNIHTAANPGGEIRGQIQTNVRKSYVFDMCAAQEVPPTSSKGFGAAMVSIDLGNTVLRYRMLVDGLSGPASAAHIHSGAEGVNGGVMVALSAPNPSAAGSANITGIQAVNIANGNTYFNVHTLGNPGGEIRGQIRQSLACPAPVGVHDLTISQLEVFPNPAGERVDLRFHSESAFQGNLRLIHTSGRQIKTEKVVVQTGEQTLRLPLDGAAPGMYFISLERLDGTRVLSRVIAKM